MFCAHALVGGHHAERAAVYHRVVEGTQVIFAQGLLGSPDIVAAVAVERKVFKEAIPAPCVEALDRVGDYYRCKRCVFGRRFVIAAEERRPVRIYRPAPYAEYAESLHVVAVRLAEFICKVGVPRCGYDHHGGEARAAGRIVEALYLRRPVVVCKVGLAHRIYRVAAVIIVYYVGSLRYRYLIEQLLPFGRVVVGAQLFTEVGYNAVFGNFKVARSAPRYGGGVYGVAERVRRGVVPRKQPFGRGAVVHFGGRGSRTRLIVCRKVLGLHEVFASEPRDIRNKVAVVGVYRGYVYGVVAREQVAHFLARNLVRLDEYCLVYIVFELAGHRFAAVSNFLYGVAVGLQLYGIFARFKLVAAVVVFVPVVAVVRGEIVRVHLYSHLLRSARVYNVGLVERRKHYRGLFYPALGVGSGVVDFNHVAAGIFAVVGHRNGESYLGIVVYRRAGLHRDFVHIPAVCVVRFAVAEGELNNALVTRAEVVFHIGPDAFRIRRFVPLVAYVDIFDVVGI